MAKAKYTKQKNGYFQARVWDGSYVDGKKHYITIRSRKSSKDLEAKVTAYNDRVSNLQAVQNKNIQFNDYAGRWLKVYKAEAANNTKRMYKNIIDKHLGQLDGVRLCDILPILSDGYQRRGREKADSAADPTHFFADHAVCGT